MFLFCSLLLKILGEQFEKDVTFVPFFYVGTQLNFRVISFTGIMQRPIKLF